MAICFMALILYRAMRMCLPHTVLGISPEIALERLRQVLHHEVKFHPDRPAIRGKRSTNPMIVSE